MGQISIPEPQQNPGPYTVQVLDSSLSVVQTLTGIPNFIAPLTLSVPPGSYRVRIIDSCSCVKTSDIFVLTGSDPAEPAFFRTSAYIGDGAIRLRALYGMPPYNYKLLALNDVVIDEVTTNDEEVAFSHTHLSGFKYQITDSLSNIKIDSYDQTTAQILGKYYSWVLFTHDNISSPGNGIDKSLSMGFPATSFMTGAESLLNHYNYPPYTGQQLWDALGTTQDYTAPHAGGPEFSIDKIIRKAYENNHALKISVSTVVRGDYVGLAFTYPESSLQKRPDGSNAISLAKATTVGMGSLAHPDYRNFVKAFMQRFINRVKNALNDGVILAIGITFDKNGEMQYPFEYENSNDTSESSLGDYNPEMVNSFKIAWPEYGSLNNNDLAYAAHGSNLHKRWYKWHSYWLKQASKEILDHIAATVTGLTRTKWHACDAGSWSDILSLRRKTYDAFNIIDHPSNFMAKSNDDSNQLMNFRLDHVASMGDHIGGISVIEPSPAAYQDSYWQVLAMVNAAMSKNIWVSFFPFQLPTLEFVDNIKNASGVHLKTTNSEKTDKYTDSGTVKIAKITYQLGDLITDGNPNGISAARDSEATLRGTSTVRTYVEDNIGIGLGTGSGSDPGIPVED